MFKSVDLYITFIYSRDEFSSIVREIVEYAINIVREKHGLNISYNEVVCDKQVFPLMIINELEPVVFNEIPSLDNIVKLLLASLRITSDRSSDLNNIDNSVLTSYL